MPKTTNPIHRHPARPRIPHLNIILHEASSFIEGLWLSNLEEYLQDPDYRTGVHALVRPWLIFAVLCLLGIDISLWTTLA